MLGGGPFPKHDFYSFSPMLVDPNGLEDLVPRKYVGAPVSLPALFVVDSAGKVMEKVLGGGADVDRIIARNLGE